MMEGNELKKDQEIEKIEMSKVLPRLIAGEDIQKLAKETGHSDRTLQARRKEILDSGIVTDNFKIQEEEIKLKQRLADIEIRKLEMIKQLTDYLTR